MAVSKPVHSCDPTARSEDLSMPARTVQLAISVAPFQLAQTSGPAGVTVTAMLGGSVGCPTQSWVKARYERTPGGNSPSRSRVPSGANSEK